jgi:peptidoglycan/xylan/chitin deacetylase (PgdA/CDA1 family)
MVLAGVVLYGLYVGIPTVFARLWRLRFRRQLQRRPAAVYLSFDDGPSAEVTPKVLEALRAAGCKAVFFLVGKNVARHPQIVRRILAEGHRIGEHSFFHYHPWRTGPIRSIMDLARSSSLMRSLHGPQERILFRPPYGKLNLVTLLYVLFARRRLVFWNLDPKDFRAPRAEEVVSNCTAILQRAGPARGASVVLLHDTREVAAGSVAKLAEVCGSLGSWNHDQPA